MDHRSDVKSKSISPEEYSLIEIVSKIKLPIDVDVEVFRVVSEFVIDQHLIWLLP